MWVRGRMHIWAFFYMQDQESELSTASAETIKSYKLHIVDSHVPSPLKTWKKKFAGSPAHDQSLSPDQCVQRLLSQLCNNNVVSLPNTHLSVVRSLKRKSPWKMYYVMQQHIVWPRNWTRSPPLEVDVDLLVVQCVNLWKVTGNPLLNPVMITYLCRFSTQGPCDFVLKRI